MTMQTATAETVSTATTNEKQIAFALYPGLTLFDLVGPLQVMSVLAEIEPAYRIVVVAERIEPTPTDILPVIATHTFEQTPRPFAMVIPGGGSPTLKAMSNPTLRAWVRQATKSAEIVASVCTGSLILGAVGLLKGREATTHWAYTGILESLGARYRRARWVEDGKFIMSAGVSAGIDMGLYLAARLTSEETAREIQRQLDYDPQPPLGGIDYSRLGLFPRTLRVLHTLAAPFITHTPKKMTAQGL
ncbi:MAG: DJ-1/PfpI family protein [Caldilineaceae bacterium]|nr:DJ-1/PfpI family protein [Caldilineaceae bacterium]